MKVLILCTVVCQKTLLTFWISGKADLAAKGDDLYIVKNPVILWKHLHQVLLDLFRIGLFGKAQPSGNPFYMGIYYYAGFMKNIPRITLAVFLPTPGRLTRSSRLLGDASLAS